MRGYERSNDVRFGCMINVWKALEVKFSMVQISSRLKFSTENYDYFSGHEQLLFSIPFLM
jgi:hypothetical protein